MSYPQTVIFTDGNTAECNRYNYDYGDECTVWRAKTNEGFWLMEFIPYQTQALASHNNQRRLLPDLFLKVIRPILPLLRG
jgi:hypothetical protein